MSRSLVSARAPTGARYWKVVDTSNPCTVAEIAGDYREPTERKEGFDLWKYRFDPILAKEVELGYEKAKDWVNRYQEEYPEDTEYSLGEA